MNEQQTLELKMKTTAQEATAKIDTLVKSLTSVENVLTNIYLDLGHIEKKSESSVQKTTKQVNSLGKSVNKASQGISKLTKMLSIGAMVVGTKKIATTVKDNLEEAMECSEALNLFNVVFKNVEKNGVTAFSNIGKEAIRFQNKLGEAFGTSSTQTLTYQALYQSMAENMGISDDKAGIMSETTVKLINDLSSLYNKSEESVANALSSGIYAGQVRPLRTYGIDLTQNSLQPVLDSLGIDRAVGSLSQAEKQILRYVAVVRQSGVAHADWASTIESPSNQLKILGNQAKEAKIAVSSLFIGTFAKVLPYANAFLMVIKEVSKAIATMFGIKIQDYNSGIASTEDSFVDLEESVDGAIGKVKELKRQTLGFDELHTINKDSGSGSSGGTSVSGGIDQRLLDAIKGYDNGMDSVKMKATEIRDKIMEWLGFTKEIDELTGEVRFKFTDTDSTLYKVVEALKKIYDNGKKVIAEVLTKIKDDFDNGAFGQVIVWILERIGDVLEFIANNQAAVDVIAHVVEALILIKGISFVGQVTGLNNIITYLKGIKTPASEAGIALEGMSKSGTSSIKQLMGSRVSESGVLGLYGALIVLAETDYIIRLGIHGFEETKKSVEEMIEAQETNTESTKKVIKGLQESRDEWDKHPESIDNVASKLTKWVEQEENAYKILDEQPFHSGTAKRGMENYNQSIKEVYDYMVLLNEELGINPELLEKVRQAYENTRIDVDLHSDAIHENKNKIVQQEDEMKKQDIIFQNYANKSAMGAINATQDLTSKINEVKSKQLGITVDTDKNRVIELNDEIKKTKDKNVALTVNANTSNLKRDIDNAIKNLKITLPVASSFGAGAAYLDVKANGGIFSHGSWKDIPQYANGGAPSHGSVFFAGENGAEIVGHVGGRTEVLNQSQIASAIYEAVVSAMSNAPLNVNVVVTGESRITDDQIVTMYENGKSKRGYDGFGSNSFRY